MNALRMLLAAALAALASGLAAAQANTPPAPPVERSR
jgi:hypothetical protein